MKNFALEETENGFLCGKRLGVQGIEVTNVHACVCVYLWVCGNWGNNTQSQHTEMARPPTTQTNSMGIQSTESRIIL